VRATFAAVLGAIRPNGSDATAIVARVSAGHLSPVYRSAIRSGPVRSPGHPLTSSS
jgi:hypothetical protein